MKDIEQFYNETKKSFFNYLLKLSGDYDLASDLMQEAYLKLYESYEDYNKSILYKIGYNLFIDYYRKEKKNVELSEHREKGENIEQSIVLKDEYKRVLQAMQKLPIEERQILSLKITTDLNYKEISELTGLSVANIKVKIHRARQKLKTYLNGGA